MMKKHPLMAKNNQCRQQGMVLIVTIIAVLAMTVAAYAMLRATSASLGIAGNLAFKKNATSAGDLGVEQARIWLMAQTSATLSANQAPGYFSAWDKDFNPLTYTWTSGTSAVQATSDDGNGNSVMYVIHRLCETTGSFNLSNPNCVYQSNSLGSGGGSEAIFTVQRPYFRITTRIAGPRNTLSYVQTIMY